MSEITAVLRLQVKEEVTSQFAKARAELEKMQKTTGQTTNVVKDLFKQLAGPAVALGSAAGLVSFAKSALLAADAMKAVHNRAEVVFGSDFQQMQDRVAGLSGQLHRSESDLLGFAVSFTSVLQGLGVGKKASEEMSESLTKLAVEMGKVFHVSDEQVMGDLERAMEGSGKALRDYGIVMSETTLQEYAHAQGIKAKVSDMNSAQKAVLEYNFVMAKTVEIEQIAAKNSDDLDDSMKQLSASWTDFQEVVGGPAIEFASLALRGMSAAVQDLNYWVNDFRNVWNGNVSETNDIGFGHGLAMGVVEIEETAKKAAPAFKSFGVDMNRTSKEAEKAGGQLKKVKEMMDDLGRSYNTASRDISRDLKQLEKDHKDKMKSIQESIDNTTKSLTRLEEQWKRTTSSLDADEVSAVADQLQKIKDIQEDIADLELRAYRENKEGSAQVETNDSLAKKRAELEREQAALQTFSASHPGVLGKGESESSKTDFEKKTGGIEERRADEKRQMEERKADLNLELQKLNERKATEERTYRAIRQEYAATTAALAAFHGDYTLKMQDLKVVTEDTAKSLQQSLEAIRNSVSQVDAEVRASTQLGQRMDERGQARQQSVPAFAEGGVVTRPTIALIGEEGPEAIVPLTGNNSPSGISIVIQSMVVHKEVDIEAALMRAARKIQLQRQLSS